MSSRKNAPDQCDRSAPNPTGRRTGIYDSRDAKRNQQHWPVLPNVMEPEDTQIVQQQQDSHRHHDGAKEKAVAPRAIVPP